ncbi:MAG: deoxyguanosinetriphosphate triphosphohydrolase [Rhizobiaceae bacterium]|nr:deoxyguanosinetriphosphate triphosphohydrolase [Rhizobiaceae bacterium]
MSEEHSYGRTGLAPFACQASESRGRLVSEPSSPTRTPFQRDRDRIVHSTAFRRMKHKTQVFVYHEGDHYRTRLTHSIEVSQIARALARAFAVDEDLAEALALSHDFGHTPFGHTGEDALNAVMADFGGFDHNAQSLRIVTGLERRYAAFDGLNLSWETLEGLVKHNGPVTENVAQSILKFDKKFDLWLDSHSSIEAQCAAIADDIAYNAHDLDDGLRAELFSLADISELPLARETLVQVKAEYPDLNDSRIIHEVIRRQITAMVEDVIGETSRRLDQLKPKSADDVRHAGRTIVAFSGPMAEKEKTIKAFLFANMYRAPGVVAVRENAHIIVVDLFECYFSGQAEMPKEWGTDWQQADDKLDEGKRARIVCDFIAGMTDRYAILEHKRLFDVTPDLG